jgi:hypothetical protein
LRATASLYFESCTQSGIICYQLAMTIGILQSPFSPPPLNGDHGARSARLLWGNQIVAGLGSHWVGVRGGKVRARLLTRIYFFRNPPGIRWTQEFRPAPGMRHGTEQAVDIRGHSATVSGSELLTGTNYAEHQVCRTTHAQ